MPRTRRKNTNWPKYVYINHGRIDWRPRIPVEHRHLVPVDKNGFLRPPVRLGTVHDPDDAIIRAWLRAKQALDARIGEQTRTLRWLVGRYMASRKFKSLAIGSQRRAHQLLRILDHPIRIDGADSTLGDAPIHAITTPIVRSIADKRLEQYQQAGRKGEAMVNREITFLSTAAKWGREHIDGIEDNPFRIEKFREQPNRRYVTDDEYHRQHQLAGEITPWLPILLELTYLLAARGIEVITLRLADIDPAPDGGITVHRRKGSRDTIITWSPRLRAAYDQARELHRQHKIADINAPLLINSNGQQLRPSTVQTAMQRLKKLMESRGISGYWSLHKLKAKAISDAQDNKIAGHRTEAMRDRYSTKTTRHRPPR